jgi:multiple sugar transport system ATP-binding protein
MAEISLEQVLKVYPGGVKAVDHVDLGIPDGSLTVLVGPSGCGKTTLLRMIAGLEEISAGTIRIGDRVVNRVPAQDRDIAMVFQSYALYPHMTVYENVAFGLRERRVNKRKIDAAVRRVADTLDLTELLGRKPGQLSGGQQQRVAMGRAIVREPLAFLMDEPLSNLDAKLRVQMRTEISRLQRDLGSTMVYVTHDQVEAMTMGDQVAVLRKGRVQQVDAPEQLYEHPANLFVAGFIGSPAMNIVEGRIAFDGEGKLQVEFGGFQLPLHGRPCDTPNLRRHAGHKVAIGIRPEVMEDASLAARVTEEETVAATVDLREALGREVLLHFTIPAPRVITEQTRELAQDAGEDQLHDLHDQSRQGRSTLVAAVDARSKAREGEIVRIFVDTERLHFFDLVTGQAINVNSP